jgi:DNA-binding NarL/FixJ family response regulator
LTNVERRKVVVVDDHEIVRNGLLATLRMQPDLRVVGGAATGAKALDLVARVHPDVALVDLRLPDMSGDDLCRELIAAAPGLKVVIHTTYLSEETVRRALAAGAAGYVTKAAGVPELLRTLAEIDSPEPSGESAPDTVKRLGGDISTMTMTAHQARILELAADGLTNSQVGERLFISESTVRFHMLKLKRQFGARTRTELIARAIRTGAIPPGPEGDVVAAAGEGHA